MIDYNGSNIILSEILSYKRMHLLIMWFDRAEIFLQMKNGSQPENINLI